MEAATILVVDDEQPIVDLVSSYLTKEGFVVHRAYDGPTALALARSVKPDLVILDVMLPGLDGIEVCRQLHRDTSVFVLMLTARADEIDKLIGLSVGADDYLTKPFSPRELVARVKAILRRNRVVRATEINQRPVLQFEGLLIDPERREVERNGVRVDLTPASLIYSTHLPAIQDVSLPVKSCSNGSGVLILPALTAWLTFILAHYAEN